MIDNAVKYYFPLNTGYSVKPYGNGHINDTYKVELNNIDSVYILQRINKSVFKNPGDIVQNHILLQDNISNKDQAIRIAQLIKGIDNYLFTDTQGNVWRMTEYIENSYTVDVIDERWQAYEAGKGFGWFVNSCKTLNVNNFKEPIKDFHSISFRINQLNDAINDDKVNRLNSVKEIVQFFKNREESLSQIEQLVNEDKIPLRVVHNDTKINNILFRNKNAVAVIDLDTVGPGSILYDYGDALRTSANSASEDEKDLEKVSFNVESFKAFSEGYLKQVSDILTKEEISYLHKAPVLMTFIMGIRFLADYLNGDIYYKTTYHDHNLDRAKVQMKLIESLESKEDVIIKTIQDILL